MEEGASQRLEIVNKEIKHYYSSVLLAIKDMFWMPPIGPATQNKKGVRYINKNLNANSAIQMILSREELFATRRVEIVSYILMMAIAINALEAYCHGKVDVFTSIHSA